MAKLEALQKTIEGLRTAIPELRGVLAASDALLFVKRQFGWR